MDFGVDVSKVSTAMAKFNEEIARPVNEPKPVNKIFVASGTQHVGALHGFVSNGGTFNIGNFQFEVISSEGPFRKIQVYQYGLEGVPEKQSYMRTKTKIIKEPKKVKAEMQQLKIQGKVTEEDIL